MATTQHPTRKLIIARSPPTENSCGIGCLGEACLYYQIGCYAGCGTCSLTGKDLYPTQADLDLADHCKPIEPTLGEGTPFWRSRAFECAACG